VLSDLKAVTPLTLMLHNPEIALVVRCEAAAALGALGGKRAEEMLVEATKDPRSSVTDAARRALGVMHQASST